MYIITIKTVIQHGQDISLSQHYTFAWDKINDFYFLKLRV